MVIKRLFLFADLILIALAVYIGVKGVYAYFESRLDTLPPAAVVQSTATSSEKAEVLPFSNFSLIAQRNLFRTVTDEEKPSSNIILEALEDTQLPLNLWSTFSSDNPENSFAIIEDQKTRKHNIYTINDSIQNATLKMILPDQVVLSVAGKDEILPLQQRTASTATASASSTRVTSTSSSSSTSTTSSTTTRRMYLSRSQVESAMENLTELMKQIRIEPYSEDGVEGLALSNIEPNSIFRRMGLRNGDILVAVDGETLTNADQALKLYQDLRSSETADIEISRKSRSINFQYRIR